MNRETRRKAKKVARKLSVGVPRYDFTTVKTNWFIPDFVHRLLINYTMKRLSKVEPR